MAKKLSSFSLGGEHDGRVTLKDFKLIEMIGVGSSGKVFLVRKVGDPEAKDFNKLFALKAVNKNVGDVKII